MIKFQKVKDDANEQSAKSLSLKRKKRWNDNDLRKMIIYNKKVLETMKKKNKKVKKRTKSD